MSPFSASAGQLIVAVLMLVGYFIFCHLQVVGFGIVFNMLHGYIDEIQGLPFGALVVAAQGAPEALREAQAYLATQEFHVVEVAL